MNTFDYINEIDSITEKLKSSEAYQHLFKMNQIMKDDSSFQILISEFQTKMEHYYKAKEMKDHYPGFQNVLNQFIQAKTNLYSHPIYIEYQGALNAFNALLSPLSDAINEMVLDVSIDAVKACRKG